MFKVFEDPTHEDPLQNYFDSPSATGSKLTFKNMADAELPHLIALTFKLHDKGLVNLP
jgi:hypothetical protein